MTTERTAIEPQRGEIWRVCFDPKEGEEINKTRPAVVVSTNSVGRLRLRIVVPITEEKTTYRAHPWHVSLKPTKCTGLTKPSRADAFQVKSVSLNRFKEHLGNVSHDDMENIAAAVAMCVGYQ